MLVRRRAERTRGLLTVAALAAVFAAVLLTSLVHHAQAVLGAGVRTAVTSAAADERSVLLRGPAGDPAALARADEAVHERFADGLVGVPVEVLGSATARGRELIGDTGTAEPDDGGQVFARVAMLDGLPEQARLVDGAWPEPGAERPQAVVGEAAAEVLGLEVGDRVPVLDRIDDQVSELRVVGVFAADDATDPYWRLVPELATGRQPGGATYGPFVLAEEDFLADGWITGGSAGWVVAPALETADLPQLLRVREAVGRIEAGLPERVGLGSAGLAQTRLAGLVDRLQRADLVGRSTLLTPLLLTMVLAGYVLGMLASLLTESRREETALLRARGASRTQLAGLALREALLVALPAAVLAAPLAALVAGGAADLPVLSRAGVGTGRTPTGLLWLVGSLAALACVVAMVLPTLRGSGTYVEDLTARSRPNRSSAIQRGGVDVALVGLAVLAWWQLGFYDSPLLGAGGATRIDPFLAAAPPLAVLAGGLLALRLVPPLTRLTERRIDRRPWFAAQLGVWQAGRRPHAGPVLLLALAVAIGALAWSLAASSSRSVEDRATFAVGADLRLVETSALPPPGRQRELAELPGVARVVPAVRSAGTLGDTDTPADVLALDAEAWRDVVQLRADLGGAGTVAAPLVDARPESVGATLPDGDRLTATARLTSGPPLAGPHTAASLELLLVDADGTLVTLPTEGDIAQDGAATRVTADLADVRRPARLVGWELAGQADQGAAVEWALDGVAVDAEPVALAEAEWSDIAGVDPQLDVTGASASGRWAPGWPSRGRSFTTDALPYRIVVTHQPGELVVPVVMTPEARRALRVEVGESTSLLVGQAKLPVQVVGEVEALPSSTTAAAVLVDLPTLTAAATATTGQAPVASEWWLDVGGDTVAASTVAAAEALPDLEVVDPLAPQARAETDPYGVGARLALFAAALGALVLAALGIAVDVRATARRRQGELAVLSTLGTRPRSLAAALVVEQGFLAGIGIVVGLGVGWAVAHLTVPLVVLTPAAERPTPPVLVVVGWLPTLATAGILLAVAVGLAALVAATARRRMLAARLRIGAA